MATDFKPSSPQQRAESSRWFNGVAVSPKSRAATEISM